MKSWRSTAAILLSGCLLLAAPLTLAGPAPALSEITLATGDMTQRPSGRPFPDMLVAFLREHGPPLAYEVVEMNARRAWQMIGTGAQVCRVSAVHTPEREKLAYFRDTLLSPPQTLIVRRNKQQALPRNAAGEIDLPRLLADPSLRGAIVDGRSYGDEVDALLAHLPPGNGVSRLSAGDFGSRMLSLLSRDRADYTIDYEVNLVQPTAREEPPLTAVLASEPIGGASAPVIAGIACPRTAWGLAAIRVLDETLGTPAGAVMLRQEAERWMTPETRQRYASQIETFYRERTRPTLSR